MVRSLQRSVTSPSLVCSVVANTMSQKHSTLKVWCLPPWLNLGACSLWTLISADLLKASSVPDLQGRSPSNPFTMISVLQTLCGAHSRSTSSLHFFKSSTGPTADSKAPAASALDRMQLFCWIQGLQPSSFQENSVAPAASSFKSASLLQGQHVTP